MFNDLVEKIDDYLDGRLSLRALREWFFDLSVDVERHFSGAFVDFVHRIERIFAEASSGGWSVAVLDRELDEAISPYRYVIVREFDYFQGSFSSVPATLLARHYAL